MTANSDTGKGSTGNRDVNIIELLLALAKRKLLILKIVIPITVLALIISLLWPVTYKSTATILPPTQDRGLAGGLGGIVGNVMQMSFGSERLDSEAILTVLNSRTIKEEIIHRFDLFEVYGSRYMEHAIKTLNNSIDIDPVREGGFGFNPVVAINISVKDGDPELARDIAHFFLHKADSVAKEINIRNARESYNLIAERYEKNQRDLERAELEFKAFQEQYGLLELEEQTRVVIGQLAALKTKEMELDIKIDVIRQSVSQNQPELRNLMRTREEVQNRISSLIDRSETAGEFNVLPSISDIPELGLNYLRLYRDVVIQNKLYENLYPQYIHRQMMITDQRKNIQIVDEANLPTYKDGPKRAFIVLAGLIFSIFLSLVVVFYYEFLERSMVRDRETYDKIQQIKKELSFRKADNNA